MRVKRCSSSLPPLAYISIGPACNRKCDECVCVCACILVRRCVLNSSRFVCMPPATSLCHVTIDLYRPQTTTFRSSMAYKVSSFSRFAFHISACYLTYMPLRRMCCGLQQYSASSHSPRHLPFHILSGLYSDKWGMMILQCGILKWVKLNDG